MNKEKIMVKDVVVRHLNELIVHAIIHGGDLGGPYDSNETGLVKAMQRAQDAFDLSQYTIREVGVDFIDECGRNAYVRCYQFIKV